MRNGVERSGSCLASLACTIIFLFRDQWRVPWAGIHCQTFLQGTIVSLDDGACVSVTIVNWTVAQTKAAGCHDWSMTS